MTIVPLVVFFSRLSIAQNTVQVPLDISNAMAETYQTGVAKDSGIRGSGSANLEEILQKAEPFKAQKFHSLRKSHSGPLLSEILSHSKSPADSSEDFNDTAVTLASGKEVTYPKLSEILQHAKIYKENSERSYTDLIKTPNSPFPELEEQSSDLSRAIATVTLPASLSSTQEPNTLPATIPETTDIAQGTSEAETDRGPVFVWWSPEDWQVALFIFLLGGFCAICTISVWTLVAACHFSSRNTGSQDYPEDPRPALPFTLCLPKSIQTSLSPRIVLPIRADYPSSSQVLPSCDCCSHHYVHIGDSSLRSPSRDHMRLHSTSYLDVRNSHLPSRSRESCDWIQLTPRIQDTSEEGEIGFGQGGRGTCIYDFRRSQEPEYESQEL